MTARQGHAEEARRIGAAPEMAALELADVDVVYARRGQPPVRAVAGASLAVPEGRIVALVGESGCGKSSLARAATGLIAPAAGSVRFHGRPVAPLGRGRRPRDLVALQMVFQDPASSLNGRRRIGDQLADGLPDELDGAARRARVAELLQSVGLQATAIDRYPHQFSGGQRQRIALARALAASPSVIVLDEPLASLDASAQAQLANLLRTLSDELRVGMLLISHDLAIVRHVADFVYVMYLGVIVESAHTRALWSSPLHPYTEALIGAIPRPDGGGRLPEALVGEVPDPARPPSGCRFHPRCRYAIERCRAEVPALGEAEPEHVVACLLRE